MEDEGPVGGMNRRDLLRRGAVIGGTLAWSAPAIQAIAKPAFAGVPSPQCIVGVRTFDDDGQCVETRYPEAEDCCDCIDEQIAAGRTAFRAALNCYSAGRCEFDDATAISSGPC
jgi:hypothetical protein